MAYGTVNADIIGTSVAGSNLGAGNATRFKNRIINGDMRIDQRNAGASQTFTAAAALAYSIDRWYGYCTGANVTGQQIAGTYATSQNQYQFTGAASVTAIGFGQRIEAKNSYDLANKTATLSCYIANSLLTTVTWTASYATTTADTFGSLASPTVTQIATGTFTVSSTRTQYTTNISIPSAATTGIQIVFSVGAQTSGTWVIDTVQLEVGSSATGFEYVDYGTQLLMCQRYYENTWYPNTSSANINATITGIFWNANYSSGYKFLTVKRTAPTVTLFSRSGTSGAISSTASGADLTTATASNIGTSGFWAVNITSSQSTYSYAAEVAYAASSEL